MPTYEYICEKCGHQFEQVQPMSAQPLELCPKERCSQLRWGKGKVKRAISGGAGLIFKGSGFYITDYRSDSYKEAAKKDTPSTAKTEPKSSGTEAKPAPTKVEAPKTPQEQKLVAMTTSASSLPKTCGGNSVQWTPGDYDSKEPCSARYRRVPAVFGCVLSMLVGLSQGFIQTARAQVHPPGAILARSYSGQFSICAGRGTTPWPRLSSLETNKNLARLDATLLPTSCERIKQMLWRELGATAPWRGHIFLILMPAISANDSVTISAEQFPDRWQYRVELPELVDRSRYVRAMVQVLLLEIANRNAGAHCAEIPAWLLEGLAQELLASSSRDELIPPPPRPSSDIMRPAATFTFVDARRPDPLGLAHASLSAAPPLSFQELSWPTEDQLGVTVSDIYRDSAQLFVDRLLDFKDGRACLRAMLEVLPEHYNWQLAFLRAFSSHFQRPLDIEKWWTLQIVHFTGRDSNQTWPREESWHKLDELIRSAVQVRFGTNDLPVHTEVPLQTIVGEWDAPRQTQALQAKLRELELLRPRIAQEFVPLVDQYRTVLATYLQNREHPGSVLPFRKKTAVRHITDEAIQQLAALEQQRISLQPPAHRAEPPSSKPDGKATDLTPGFPNQARSER